MGSKQLGFGDDDLAKRQEALQRVEGRMVGQLAAEPLEDDGGD